MTDKGTNHSKAQLDGNTGPEMMTESKPSKVEMNNSHDRKELMAKWPLFDIKEPHDHDVLFGRGGGTNHHPGNKRFREMVEERKVDYLKRNRRDKFLVAVQLVHEWRGQDPPGRFLKRDERTGLWNDVGDEKAREKTSQSLREGAPNLRKQICGEPQEPRDAVEEVRDKPRDDLLPKRNTARRVVSRQVLVRNHTFGKEYLDRDQAFDVEDFTWEIKKSSEDSRATSPFHVHEVSPSRQHDESHHLLDYQDASAVSTPPRLPSSPGREAFRVPFSEWRQRDEESSFSIQEWNSVPPKSFPNSYSPRHRPTWEYQTFPQQREISRSGNEGGYPMYAPPYPSPRWAMWDANGLMYQSSPPWHCGASPTPSSPPYLPYVKPQMCRDNTDAKVPSNRYDIDPTVASIWSCQSQDELCTSWSTSSGERDRFSTCPETPPEPSDKTAHRPFVDVLKRRTSHQCETIETRGNLDGSSVKKLALNRDESSTANRLKGLCKESNIRPKGINVEVENLSKDFKGASLEPSHKPEHLTIEERMTSLDLIEKDLLERPVSLTGSNRSSTVDALNLDLDGDVSSPPPVSLFRSTTMQEVFLEFQDGIPRSVPLSQLARLSSEDVTELVNEPISDDGLIDTPIMARRGKVGNSR